MIKLSFILLLTFLEMAKSEDFNLEIVHDSFEQCLKDDILDMDLYLKGYNELHRFFEFLGRIFSFVATDIKEKIHILENHRKSDSGNFYETIQKMINYEISNDILTITSSPSGSRTLLRLHRALDFMASFLEKLGTGLETDKVSHMAQQSYQDSLAKFHPWLIQKAAVMAMYSLPTLKTFIQNFGKSDFSEVQKNLLQTVSVIRSVYIATQKLYEDNNLLDLP